MSGDLAEWRQVCLDEWRRLTANSSKIDVAQLDIIYADLKLEWGRVHWIWERFGILFLFLKLNIENTPKNMYISFDYNMFNTDSADSPQWGEKLSWIEPLTHTQTHTDTRMTYAMRSTRRCKRQTFRREENTQMTFQKCLHAIRGCDWIQIVWFRWFFYGKMSNGNDVWKEEYITLSKSAPFANQLDVAHY